VARVCAFRRRWERYNGDVSDDVIVDVIGWRQPVGDNRCERGWRNTVGGGCGSSGVRHLASVLASKCAPAWRCWCVVSESGFATRHALPATSACLLRTVACRRRSAANRFAALSSSFRFIWCHFILKETDWERRLCLHNTNSSNL